MSTLSQGQTYRQYFFINQTDLLAGTSVELICPADGFVNAIATIVQAAVTTGGTIKAISGVVDVVGAVVTVPNAAAKGSQLTAQATLGDDTRAVTKGQRIQVKPTSFATAGAVNGYVEYVSAKSKEP